MNEDGGQITDFKLLKKEGLCLLLFVFQVTQCPRNVGLIILLDFIVSPIEKLGDSSEAI